MLNWEGESQLCSGVHFTLLIFLQWFVLTLFQEILSCAVHTPSRDVSFGFMNIQYTPMRLYHIKRSNSPFCWRQCSRLGIFPHIWWECKWIKPFWRKILSQIRSLTGYPILAAPEIALLNLWNKVKILNST